MEDRYAVQDITIDRDASSLTIVFGDDVVGRYDLGELRANCPCAGCRGARDGGVAPWPPAGRPDAELGVRDARLVGAWGLGITWSDGHEAGIFPWEGLRRWHDDDEPRFTHDQRADGVTGRGGSTPP